MMELSYPVEQRDTVRVKTCSNNIDKFSTLPDPILHHILSFVGARQAVKMTVLSKRWKNVWTSTPNLFFDDQDFQLTIGKDNRIHAYTNFVKAELTRHAKSNIMRFRFVWRYGINMDSVSKWVRHAIESDAQELDIFLPKHSPYDEMLLEFLYSCTSKLQVLLLQIPTSRPPVLTGFNMLKTLVLSFINSPHNKFGEQLIGCTALENLSLCLCSFKSIKISNVRLEKFALCDSKVSDQDIEVSAPHLLSFEYDTRYEIDTFRFENSSSLVIAKISIRGNFKKGDKLSDILTELYNIRTLTFIAFNLQCKRNKESFFKSLPMFMNLKHLEMKEVPGKAMKAVKEILQHSPNLENLRIINSKRKRCKKPVEHHMKRLKRLRTVVIDGFGGNTREHGLLNYLERNAGILKRKKTTLSFNQLE